MPLPVDPSKYTAFLGAMFVMAISPGPANLFFMRTGLSGSVARVLVGVVGINFATFLWFIASAIGLQILMSTFPLLFQIVAVAGGLYLIWIGFKGFRSALSLANEHLETPTRPEPDKTLWQTARDGFFVQILNPKVTLFFSAVLPPFVDIHRPMPAQMAVFAMTTIGMDVVSMTSYGLGAVRLANLLSDPRNKQKFDLATNAILLILGILICLHSVSDLLKIL